ncbi:MAG: RNA methyltransferase [Flavobacteriaceae bacterium]
MAGTDRHRERRGGGPAIILVRPQLGENIGAAARAMANFGLDELRIVAPRDGWPNPFAVRAASGADWVIEKARIFDTTEDAIADLTFTLATTARPRGMTKHVLGPQAACEALHERIGAGAPAGLLFGAERTGLDNDDVALADAIVTFPVNPAFASLNLGQAVLLIAYEYARHADPQAAARRELATGGSAPASRTELMGFFEHLETELDRGGFLKPADKKPSMIRNLRNLFHRTELTAQDVRTLRGVIVALTGRPFRRDGEPT